MVFLLPGDPGSNPVIGASNSKKYYFPSPGEITPLTGSIKFELESQTCCSMSQVIWYIKSIHTRIYDQISVYTVSNYADGGWSR